MLVVCPTQFPFWLATMLCVAVAPLPVIGLLLCRFRLWMGLVAVVFVALALAWLRSFGPWPALLYMWKLWWWQELTVLGVAFGLTAWVVIASRRSGGQHRMVEAKNSCHGHLGPLENKLINESKAKAGP